MKKKNFDFFFKDYEEPYCVVELDSPMQKHLTDVHKDVSSINEQFLFDITPSSEELSIYVYDRAKDYGSNILIFLLKLHFILQTCIKVSKKVLTSH